MMGSWNGKEIKVLIAILGQGNVLDQLERDHRSCDIYQHIAIELGDNEYVKRCNSTKQKLKIN